MKSAKPALFAVLCLIMMSAQDVSAASKYAYLTKNQAAVYGNGKIAINLKAGTTIKYDKLSDTTVKFKYKSKMCKLNRDSLIYGDNLVGYVKQHPDQFNQTLETTGKTQVFCADGSVLRSVSKGTRFKLFGESKGLYKVQLDGIFGWIDAGVCRRLCIVDVISFPKVSGKTKGARIVNYAEKWVGNPYVWGGTSLTSGADCSGFVQSVYKYFGYSLPRCSWEQAAQGKKVSFSKMKPGDLIFYYRGSKIGHVTIYAGNGKCVQARGKNYGIVITDWDYSIPAFARRIL